MRLFPNALPVLAAAVYALVSCSGRAPDRAEAVSQPAADSSLEVVASVSATEGPAEDGDGNVFFTDLVNQRILQFTPTGVLSIFRDRSNGANGLMFDPAGRLLICEGSDRRRATEPRVTRFDFKTGQTEVLASSYKGQPFRAPNDLTLDDRGRIYFSDAGPPGPGGGALFRIDPDGTVHQLLGPEDLERPQGVLISPDERTMYVVEANRVPQFDRRSRPRRQIRAYDFDAASGTVSNGRVFYDFYPGRSADGLCGDVEGNIYAAAGMVRLRATDEDLSVRAGIYKFSPAGRLVEFMAVDEDLISNCAFGGADGKTIWVTAGKSLYKLPSKVPGRKNR
jgi:gluconolactonase